MSRARRFTLEAMPRGLEHEIVRWLKSNEKKPAQVRWGHFPLGMVKRWIERAKTAEADRDRAVAYLRRWFADNDISVDMEALREEILKWLAEQEKEQGHGAD